LDLQEQYLTKIIIKRLFFENLGLIFTNEHPTSADILSNSNIVIFDDNGNDCCINKGPISKLLNKKKYI
jgi:hypothetical protein